jgi:hypothetical protein
VLKVCSASSILSVVMLDFVSTHVTRSLHERDAMPDGVFTLIMATLAGPRLLVMADCSAALALLVPLFDFVDESGERFL